MPVNRGSRHNPKWSGFAKYKGRRKWIGTHDNMEEFRKAKERCLAELREEAANPSRRVAPTVLEFAGATIHENGRITMTWPDGEATQKETGRRDSSVRRLRDGLRPFLREFHDRPIDSFTRDEAVTWTRPKGANIQQAVRQFAHWLVYVAVRDAARVERLERTREAPGVLLDEVAPRLRL